MQVGVFLCIYSILVLKVTAGGIILIGVPSGPVETLGRVSSCTGDGSSI
jgi:hypothetical protein